MNTSKPVTSYMLEYWDKSPGPQDKPGSAKALILQRTGKALAHMFACTERDENCMGFEYLGYLMPAGFM